VNNCFKLLWLVLLVKPVPGLGQEAPASRLESLVATAQQAQAANDYAAAADAYKQAVRIEPNMPELWANLGLMEQQTGDTPGALQSFLHANRINPSLYVPNLFLGIDLVHTGKAPEAIPFLSKAEKINKTDPQAPLALGRAYYATRKYSAAAGEFARATAVDPKLGAAWFDLGIARLGQVEEDARRLSEEGKDSAFAGALYAESLEKQARFGEASTLYKSLIPSRPQPPCIHSELGFSLLRGHDQPGAAAEFAAERAAHPECGLALLGQARMAMDAGDSDREAKLLQELWGRDHGFVESNAAILLEGLPSDRISAALGFLTQENAPIQADLRNALLAAFNGTGQEPGDRVDGQEAGAPSASEPVSAARNTAEEYYAAGEFQRCARRLEAGLAAGSAYKLRLLAVCSYFAGDNERACGAATAWEALQPHSLEALYWSIQANERLALESLARFQQMEPESARSHVLLGDIYYQLERFDSAQAEYSKALDLDPGNPAAMLGLATAYLSNNNIEKTIETAQLALVNNPEDPDLNLVIAEAMLLRHQFAESLPFLDKSLHAKPQLLPHVHALIGSAYAGMDRNQEAIEQLKMGLSSDISGSLHYQLARLYHKIGDEKNASAAMEEMKTIKQQRRERGVKTVEDPDLSSLESPPGEASVP
jgi:tetratricopeptide (TPR) repeat protein